MADSPKQGSSDILQILIGLPVFLAALAVGLFFLFGLPDSIEQMVAELPAWIGGLATLVVLIDALVLSFVIRRISRHRLAAQPFLERLTRTLSDEGPAAALAACQATGPRGVARLLAAWIETAAEPDTSRQQAVAAATLTAARELERDARAARWAAVAGSGLGVTLALGGVGWSALGTLPLDQQTQALALTLVGLALLLPALAGLSYVAANVTRAAQELQAALPVIAAAPGPVPGADVGAAPEGSGAPAPEDEATEQDQQDG